jgi:hypothetical protein
MKIKQVRFIKSIEIIFDGKIKQYLFNLFLTSYDRINYIYSIFIFKGFLIF